MPEFDDPTKTAIQWARGKAKWPRSIKSGEYLKYYETQYAGS